MAIKFLNTVVVDAGVLKVDASSNRVGINTNNPGGELQVVGAGSIGNIYISANAAGSSVTDSLHIKKEALKASIINRDGGDLALGANNSEKVTIKGTGNVGIGTTSPNSKLQVDGEIDANGGDGYKINGKPWAAESSNNLRLGDWDGEGFSTSIYGSNSSEVMRVTGNNVGIGTTSPSAKLDIINSGLSTMFRLSNTETNATTKYGAIVGRHYTNTEENVTGMLITSSSSSTGGTVSIGGGISAANAVNNIILYTAANNTTLTGTERMRITSAGNVGIGTTNPLRKLDLVADLTTDAVRIKNTNSNGGGLSVFAANGGGGANRILTLGDSSENIKVAVIENGTVGIGTTSPQEKVHVSGSSNVRLEVEATDSTVAALKLTNTAGSYASFVDASGSLSTYDYNAASTRTTLLANGNLGIGTTTPSAKLDVVQATTANGAAALHLIGPNTNPNLTTSVLIIEQSDGKKITMDGNDIDVSSGDLFINDYSGEDVTFGGQIKVKGLGSPVGDSYIANGNFGVGTTSPQEKLHVMEEVPGDTLLEVENTRSSSTAGVKLSSGQTNYNVAFTDSDGNFQIYNRATNRIEFHIGANGRVGIDTTNPAVGTKLEVAGKVKADNYINQRVAWNVGFNHGSNNTASYYFIPVGYLAETTSDTYYNNWIAPYAGRVRKIVMRNTGTSTVPTATTVNFRVSVNGSVVYTGSTITVTGSGLNILASQTLSDTNAVFSATDRVQVAYRTNGLWRNAATGISLEYTE